MNKIVSQILFITTLIVITVFKLSAQANNVTVSGTVSDSGETMPGVSVVVLGTTIGTTTDIEGRFSIRAPRGSVIRFSFMGFQDFEYFVAGDASGLNIPLTEDASGIEEVVITAAGRERRISALAAITSVDASELQTPSPSITNMLGGRVAGIITMQSSGEPGKNLAEFWIRGIGTFGANSSALVLIDGLEGDINTIDPADIESFSILKDASATAVYGSRGANGVVLITTKRGETGRLSITARANVTMSHIRRLPDYIGGYDYAVLSNEARAMRGESPNYKDVELEIIRRGLDPDLYPDINWQKEIIRPISFRQAYYLSGRGGSGIARYFVSLGATNEQGAYKTEKGNYYTTNVGYNSYTFRLNLDVNLTQSTVLRFNSDAFLGINDRPGMPRTTDDLWNIQARFTPVLMPRIYSNGEFPYVTGGGASPYMLLNYAGKTKMTDHNAKFSIAVEQDLSALIEGLRVRVLGAYDRNGNYTETRMQFPAMHIAQGRDTRGELVTRQVVAADTQEFYSFTVPVSFRRFQFESALNYDRVFSVDHRVGALFYLHMNDQMATDQFLDDEMAGLTMAYSQIPRRYLRFSSRFTYGYKDTYMFDFNFGYTGTENFQPGRQYAFFPSFAVGWIPTQYDFVQDVAPWMNLFKVRASYGMVGNDRIGGMRFPYLNRISQYYGAVWGGITPMYQLRYTRVGADNLEWERAIKSNIGVDIRMFSENLVITSDFFHDRRNGIFQQRVQVPGHVGLPVDPWGNVGAMISWGSDGNIGYTHHINRNMFATVRANYTYSRNKILNYERLYENYPYRDFTNQPNNVVRGYQVIGFFKDEDDIAASPRQPWGRVMPGDLKYKDINGDGVISEEDMVPISYHQMFPLFSYGFGGSFHYKAFSVGVLFRGTGKVDYYRNNTGYIPFNDNRMGNVLKEFADPSTRWIPAWYAEQQGMEPALAENPNAKLPRMQYGHNSNNTQTSNFWLGNAQYLRLQEVTLNYNLRNDFLKRIGIVSIDLQLVGNNLHIWDKVKIFDPEQAHRSGTVYPIPTTYAFQLYINL
jgi:TonB-linked SusC/RagA family outer membrane protein